MPPKALDPHQALLLLSRTFQAAASAWEVEGEAGEASSNPVEFPPLPPMPMPVLPLAAKAPP